MIIGLLAMSNLCRDGMVFISLRLQTCTFFAMKKRGGPATVDVLFWGLFFSYPAMVHMGMKFHL